MKIENYLKNYIRYKEKANNNLANIIDEVAAYCSVFPDEYMVEDFPGDGIGIYPTHMVMDRDYDVPTYDSLHDVISAMKAKEVIDEKWFENNVFM